MGSVFNDIETIKIANNLHNTQMLSLINNLQNYFDNLINEKKQLIINIARDYKLNEKELMNKYINMDKTKGEEDKQVPVSLITENNDKSDDDTEDEEKVVVPEVSVAPVVKRRGRIPNALKKTMEVSTATEKKEKNKVDKSDTKSMEEVEVDSETQKAIMKYIKIKDKQYLLDIGTNEIFDTEHNKVGRKDGNKCIFTKSSSN